MLRLEVRGILSTLSVMRGLTRRWLMDERGGTSASPVHAVGAAMSPTPLLDRILHARGLTDPESIAQFCEPKLSQLHPPELMPGVDCAAARIIDAIKRDQIIVIYGDYDVDGITATAILYHVIKTIKPGARLHMYVPHRLEEGYGINCDALKQIRKDGADLVISVDCGITAVESAKTASEIGLDLIITDHHNFREDGQVPDALIVHPRLIGMPGGAGVSPVSDTRTAGAAVPPYPFPDLCGAGVAFKLAWRLATMWCNSERVSESLQKTLLHMLPLVALGTIADVVPLVDENRVLTAFGLRMIKQTPLVGLNALIEASGLAGETIDCEKVGFSLAPRLNACGRLGHARDAIRLLTEASAEEADQIAQQLTRVNMDRRNMEKRIFDRACQLAEDRGMVGDACRIIVLADEQWHPGVVGIVCSRLVDRFGRPAVLMQANGEYCKGSARSIDGYSIHDGLASCATYLASYGGHDMAAGLTLHAQHLNAFTESLTAHANDRIAPDQLTPALHIDCDAMLRELDLPTVQKIASLSPFGRANRRPTLRVQNAVVVDTPKPMGQYGKHLSLRLRQDTERGQIVMRTVWWNQGSLTNDFAPGMKLDAVIEPKLNAWNGRVSVEAEIRDVRFRGGILTGRGT